MLCSDWTIKLLNIVNKHNGISSTKKKKQALPLRQFVWHLPHEGPRVFITHIQIFRLISTILIFSSASFFDQGLSTLLPSFTFHDFALLLTHVHFFKSNPTICTISSALPPLFKVHHRMCNAVLIELQQNTEQIKGTFHYDIAHPLAHSTILTLKLTLRPIDKSLSIALHSNCFSSRIN